MPSPENFGTFSLEMARFGANLLTEMSRTGGGGGRSKQSNVTPPPLATDLNFVGSFIRYKRKYKVVRVVSFNLGLPVWLSNLTIIPPMHSLRGYPIPRGL